MSRFVYKILTFLFTLASIYAEAQIPANKDPNEFSIYFGAGLSSIHYQDAPQKNLFNGYAIDFGVGYTFYFHRNWGIYIGVGPGIYNTKKNVELDVLNPGMTDRNNYLYDLHTQAAYAEAFQTMFLNVPVMLQFQTTQKNVSWNRQQSNYKGFYIMAGVKTSLPLEDRYESEITTITNAAYYPDFDNWAATQKFAGLGKFNEASIYEGNMDINIPSLRLAFETGLKWRLKSNSLLYTGIFCHLGLNNTTQNARMPIRNSIAVDHITDFYLITFTDKIDMITAGIILRIAFFRPHQASCPFSPYKEHKRR